MKPIDQPRRWFQFSLRTIFVVVTLLCVWAAKETNRVRQQRRAVEIVQRLEGRVFYEHQGREAEPPGPRWLRAILGDDYFCRVTWVELVKPISDDDWPVPGDDYFYRATELDLGGGVSDDEWRTIGSLSSLSTLWMPPVSETALGQIRNLKNLTYLILTMPVTDRTLELVGRYSNLDSLIIGNAKQHPAGSGPLTDQCLAPIGRLTNLVQLQIVNCPITDAALVHLKGLNKLIFLNLTGTDITDEGIVHLKSLPLEIVFLDRTKVTAEGIRELATIPTVSEIYSPNIDAETTALLKARAGSVAVPANSSTPPTTTP